MTDLEDAMDAGYAEGVLATEARAIKRIDALEAEVGDLMRKLDAAQEVISSVRVYFNFTGGPANMLKALNAYDEATKS